jgi:hypothetical protein
MNKFKLTEYAWFRFEVFLVLIALIGFPFVVLCIAMGMRLAELFFG